MTQGVWMGIRRPDPKGSVVRKQDIYIAKNYLSENEIDSLNRYVTVFLETAELRARNKEDITMDFWKENVDRILEFTDQKILQGKGSISHQQMEEIVDKIYENYDSRRKKQDADNADIIDMEELKLIEDKLNQR